LTARQSLVAVGCGQFTASFAKFNPSLIDATLTTVWDTTITALGKSGVMVLLDNTMSKAGWCCSYADGNGWFDEGYFNTTEWAQALTFMANRYKPQPHVVALSLRNELRNESGYDMTVWYKYMVMGANAISVGNPNALVFVGGVLFEGDLMTIQWDPITNYVRPEAKSQVVYEAHWYGC
jgi:aryl-phospho-beta-D-glucosidase BglC (GH1 family)